MLISRLLPALFVALAACSSTVDQQTSSTTGGTTTTTNHGGNGGAGTGGAGTGGAGAGTPACEVQGEFDVNLPDFECALPSPCPPAIYHEDGPYDFDAGAPLGPHFDDPAAPTCLLQKLRDRDIVQLYFEGHPADDFIGQHGYMVTVFILDAEHGASNARTWYDLSYIETRNNRQILKPASFFDACLQETDPAKIYACLTGWSAGCADVDVPCPLK